MSTIIWFMGVCGVCGVIYHMATKNEDERRDKTDDE